MGVSCAQEVPYTHHKERDDYLQKTLRVFDEIGGYPHDIEEVKERAIENNRLEIRVDAASRLVGQKVLVSYAGTIYAAQCTVTRIERIDDVNSSNELACFGIVHQNNEREEDELLPIFPSTKVSIMVESEAMKRSSENA